MKTIYVSRCGFNESLSDAIKYNFSIACDKIYCYGDRASAEHGLYNFTSIKDAIDDADASGASSITITENNLTEEQLFLIFISGKIEIKPYKIFFYFYDLEKKEYKEIKLRAFM